MPFGYAMMVLQFLIVFYGLPKQIYELYKAKTSRGHAVEMHLLCAAASACGFFHGTMEKPNPFLALPQIPAVIFGAVIIGQIIYYRRFYRSKPVTVSAS